MNRAVIVIDIPLPEDPEQAFEAYESHVRLVQQAYLQAPGDTALPTLHVAIKEAAEEVSEAAERVLSVFPHLMQGGGDDDMGMQKFGEGKVLHDDEQKTAGQQGLSEEDRQALQRENDEADSKED